ncbi:MAG TPA: T9SS type A sorting domain-containing protein, partial [Bacteroidia bacterium]|nr:T9SS type A sorting domain-containing protein [Bacteroidia bacterium]
VRLSKDTKTGLLIYPNPSPGQVWASIVAAKTGEAKYSVIDMNSKLITEKRILLYAGNNTISLSELDNRQPGIYFIKMVLDGQVFTRKIVKTK